MATATERIPILVSSKGKTQIARMAKESGLSIGEYLRRAAASFRPDDEEMLEGMIDQMLKTTAQAGAAIDEALAFVEASNKRIAKLEAKLKGNLI